MAKEKEINTDDMTDEELKKAAEEQGKDEKDSLFSGDKDSEKEEDKKEDEPSLEERFESLEKESKGFYESMKAERGKRQELEGRLEGIKDVFSESMAKREESAGKEESKPIPIERLKIDVDDDGTAFLPVGELKSYLSSQGAETGSKEVAELRQQIARDRAIYQQEQGFQNTVQSIVGESPAYASAHNQLQKGVDWFSARIIAYQEAKNLTGVMSTGEALDVADSEGFESEFVREFPGLDMERTVRMYDGKRDLRAALKSVAGDKTSTGGKTAADNLKDIAGKASNLSQLRNQKGSKGAPTLDDLAEMDIENFSDEEVAKLHRLMAREEETA